MRFDFIALYALVGTAFVSTSIAAEPRLTFSKRVLSNPDLSATKVAGQAIPIANSQAQSIASLFYQLSKALDDDTDFMKPKKAGSSLPVSGTPASAATPPKPATSPKKEAPSPKKEAPSPKKETTPPKKEEEDDDETT
ncbi:hypothetical protein O0I10_002202 [Lichtheimia ornata]|uniref:Uncharacterized protein n=1 Tax=Lichtheimia ornata TaxID=688661 RepID=A0AAD7VCU2_9FUNG|nr:uncharacterized protein O0I10_002202 [Lichtheimia ornata]KAJ8661871.1 hypothetical protein O0I10_002202 [Lichtheimia ornata]